MAFWLIICVLLAGAAALLVVPAMRHGKQSAADAEDEGPEQVERQAEEREFHGLHRSRKEGAVATS